jgi:segregation and condensation protein B
MNFRDFLRSLIDNLRALWQSAFSAGSGSTAIPGGQPAPPSAVGAPTPQPTATDDLTAEPVRTFAADVPNYGGEVSISIGERVEPTEQGDAANGADAEFDEMSVDLDEDMGTQANDEHDASSEEAEAVASADVDGVTNDFVEDGEATADVGVAVDEAGVPVMVQAPLEIAGEDDPLAAEIMVESYGRRMGLSQLIESLLFVSDEPVDSIQLAKALNVSLEAVEASVQRLNKLYHTTNRGLRLQTREGRHSLVTAPECAGAIEDFLNLDLTTKLSGPALETLAVIAYRQPVTRIQVEAVRGVDCSGVLRSMTQRGLIEEVGRLETVGRPILYGVTDLFMQHFGLLELTELPPLAAEDEDMLWAATQLAELEGGVEFAALADSDTEASDTEVAVTKSDEEPGSENVADAAQGTAG